MAKHKVHAKTNTLTAVRDKYGKLLMKEDKILERWKEHCTLKKNSM